VAVRAQWEAVALSQSKTYAFAIIDDAVALLLGWLVLDDGAALPVPVWIGAALAFVGLFFMRPASAFDEARPAAQKFGRLVITFSVIWGFAHFIIRFLPQVERPSVGNFPPGWYAGSFAGASILRAVFARRERGESTCALRTRAGAAALSAALVL